MKAGSAFPRMLRRFARDRRGVGAVEFALLFPILLVAYLSAFELTVAFSVAKRATSSASTVADLLTQQSETNKAYLVTMGDVAKSIFVPYSTTGLSLKLTGIKIDDAGAAKVAWSWKNDGTRPYAVDSSVTLPEAMATPGTFLVRSELAIPHRLLLFLPDFSGSNLTTLNIAREYFYRKRSSDDIKCSDC